MRKALFAGAAVLFPALACAAELHVSSRAGAIPPGTLARFEAETGIAVTYDVFGADDALEAKLLAGGSGYDVVVPSSTFLRRQIPVGVYRPLDRARLANWGKLDPQLMGDAEADDPGNAHAVALS